MSRYSREMDMRYISSQPVGAILGVAIVLYLFTGFVFFAVPPLLVIAWILNTGMLIGALNRKYGK